MSFELPVLITWVRFRLLPFHILCMHEQEKEREGERRKEGEREEKKEKRRSVKQRNIKERQNKPCVSECVA